MINRKKIIIIIIVALLLIGLGCIIYFTTDNNSKPKELSNQEIEENIQSLTNIIMNEGTEEELAEALNSDAILETDIMTGEDMYLRKTPADYIQAEYPLDEYITLSKTLADNLEQKIKDNFDYEITSITKENNETLAMISYKTYYYNAYLNDLKKIRNNLLTRAGYDVNHVITSDELTADIYKASIKAALILDSMLDRYDNNNEFLEIGVTYNNDNPEESAYSLMSYFIALTGYNYSNTGYLQTDEDVNNILASYDLTDPLAI